MSGILEAKKLVSVLTTSTLITGARKEALECVFYIYYRIQFKKNKTQVQALINLESEVNASYLSFTKQLSLPIRPIDVGTQKIDGTTLDTYAIVVAVFLMMDKANQVRFFEEIFLVANFSPKIVFGMSFLTLSGANIDFSGRELR